MSTKYLVGLLLAGGYFSEESTEVVQISGAFEDLNCGSLADVSTSTANAAGGSLNGKPLICGGRNANSEN